MNPESNLEKKSIERMEAEEFFKEVVNSIFRLGKFKKDSQSFDREIINLKNEWIQENPDKAMALELIFDLKWVLEASEELRNKSIERSRLEKLLRQLTEWQSKVVSFLNECQDENFVRNFWESLEKVGGYLIGSQARHFIRENQRGLVGQVGILKTLKAMGIKAELATPDEDALEKIDFWILPEEGEKLMPVQMKHTGFVKKPFLISTDEINYPAIIVQSHEWDTYFQQGDIQKMIHFKESCQDKAFKTGRKVKGVWMACPIGSFDKETGEPTKEFLKQIEPEIKKYLE